MGVRNGWGYGIAFLWDLNFQILKPEIWRKSLFLRNYRDFPGNSASEKQFFPAKFGFGLWKMAIP